MTGLASRGLDDGWVRPHPLTILALIGDIFRGAGLGFAAVFVLNAGNGIDWVELALAGATFGSGLVRWFTTRYRVDDRVVEHRYGVFRRHEQVMERSRIQNVGLTSPLIARVLGLSSVDIAEASADGNISIRYLAVDEAERMAQLLEPVGLGHDPQRFDNPPVTGDTPLGDLPAPGAAPSGGPRLTTLHTGDLPALWRFELGRLAPSVLMVIPAVFVAVVLSRTDAPTLVRIGLPIGMVLTPALGIVQPLLVYGGFRLDRTGGGLELRGGLLTERRVVIQPERIQTLTWTDHPVGRRTGLRSLSYSSAEAGGGGVESGELTIDLDRLVPASGDDEVDRLATLAGRPVRVPDDRLEQVSPLTVRRAAVRWSVPVVGFAAGWFVHPLVPLAIVPWLVGAWLAARRRHDVLGVATDGTEVVGRTGWWVTETTRLSIDRIQGIAVNATPFQRRLGLATLTVGTAGMRGRTSVVVPDLPVSRAEGLARELATAAARAEEPFEL